LPPASASTRSSPDVCGREEHQGQPPGTRTRRHAALLCLPQLLATLRLLSSLFSSPHNNLDSRSTKEEERVCDAAPWAEPRSSASRADDQLLLGSRP
jgi:hypothetical protein